MIRAFAALDQHALTTELDHDSIVQRYRSFFALLDWTQVPERTVDHPWPQPGPHPESAYVKTLLVKLCEQALLAVLGLAVTIAASVLVAASALLLGLTGIAVTILVPNGWVVWTSRWHVDPNRIGGRNNWFVYQRLDWSDMESVEPFDSRVPVRAGERGQQAVGVLAALVPHQHARISISGSTICPHRKNPLRRYLEQQPVKPDAEADRSPG